MCLINYFSEYFFLPYFLSKGWILFYLKSSLGTSTFRERVRIHRFICLTSYSVLRFWRIKNIILCWFKSYSENMLFAKLLLLDGSLPWCVHLVRRGNRRPTVRHLFLLGCLSWTRFCKILLSLAFVWVAIINLLRNRIYCLFHRFIVWIRNIYIIPSSTLWTLSLLDSMVVYTVNISQIILSFENQRRSRNSSFLNFLLFLNLSSHFLISWRVSRWIFWISYNLRQLVQPLIIKNVVCLVFPCFMPSLLSHELKW